MTALSRRRFARLAAPATMLATFKVGAASAFVPSAVAAEALAHVDPELRTAAKQMLAIMAKLPPLSDANLAAFRAAVAAFERPRRPDVPVAERRIPGPRGAPDVRIYVVNANPGAGRPGILHTHGGGFVSGEANFDVPNLQEMAAALDAVIVTVDYRLAPETLFIGSIDDNHAGLKWMYDHAGEIGLDRKRIAVSGESAGGGLAALLAIAARDRGDVPILFQSLAYPMLDDRTGSGRAVAPHMGLLWTAEQNRFGWRSFLGQEPGTASIPPTAVPARTADVSGLPPAWIGVGSIDLFVDEAIEYARRLINAGSPTELLVVPGAYHSFDEIAPGTSPAARFRHARLNALKRAFAAASA